MKRVTIRVELFGQANRQGEVSHDLVYTDLRGHSRRQSYYAVPEETTARLRHNLADDFWFRRYRRRIWREARERHHNAHMTERLERRITGEI